MAQYHESYGPSAEEFTCAKCQVALENGPIILHYMGHDFPVLMPKCPICGQGLIPEALALGKILDVEQGLEDK